MQYPIDNLTFINNVTVPTISLEYIVKSGMDVINIEIESTGTFSLQLEGKVNSNSTIWKTLIAGNLTTADIVSVITNSNYAYQYDLKGWSVFRINATAVSGTLTVYGKAVG